MRNTFCLLIFYFLVACSNSNERPIGSKVEENPKEITENLKIEEKAEWLTFVSNESYFQDTTEVNFQLKFKYPSNLIAEAIENGRCIGKKRKPDGPDDPMTNTMDCCIWLTDLKAEPIDYYLAGERRKIKPSFKEVKDTIIIANKKSLRVQFLDNKTKNVLVDYVFVDLDDYKISLQIYNERL